MKFCVCGNRALYFCKSHKVDVCNKHKAMHEKGKQKDHIYEKLGHKLTAEELVKIVDSLSSKIKIAGQCADQIIEESSRLIEMITSSCILALETIEKKKQCYADLLRNCKKRIFDDQIEELQRIARTSLLINIPQQFVQLIELYSSNFLTEFERVKDITVVPVKQEMPLFEKGYNLYLEAHSGEVRAVAITSDSKYIVSGGDDSTVRIWNLQEKTQEAVLKGHTSEVRTVVIGSGNKYIVSGGHDSTVRIWISKTEHK